MEPRKEHEWEEFKAAAALNDPANTALKEGAIRLVREYREAALKKGSDRIQAVERIHWEWKSLEKQLGFPVSVGVAAALESREAALARGESPEAVTA